jgi:hypothetical protein
MIGLSLSVFRRSYEIEQDSKHHQRARLSLESIGASICNGKSNTIRKIQIIG